MLNNSLNDTIAAISTPVGDSGIGIVRLSGGDALKISDRIFVSKDGKKPSEYKTYTVHYGWIMETQGAKVRQAQNGIIDEVLLTIMRAPRSYTKEDIVEINCHAGIVALRKVLDLVLEEGARLAEPGEFTKRAFLNGRIDLAQAEAVLDIIRAKTDAALKAGAEQLRGALSEKLNNFRNIILGILSTLEANIDFPEEEIGAVSLNAVRSNLEGLQKEINALLSSSARAKVLREGLHAVICGRPNVGKSSLLNALLKEERSIVTKVAGTTRDTIEEIIDIRGIPVRIVDTAGIIEPRDLVEKKAVQRSKKQIDSADLVLLVFDGTYPLSREDEGLMKRLKIKKVLAVINKIDLKQRIEKEKIIKIYSRAIEISAKKGKNISLLEEEIANLNFKGGLGQPEPLLLGNSRHIQKVRLAQKLIEETLDSLDNKLPVEFIAQGLKEALGFLDDILGRQFQQDLLDRIFCDFCIGK